MKKKKSKKSKKTKKTRFYRSGQYLNPRPDFDPRKPGLWRFQINSQNLTVDFPRTCL